MSGARKAGSNASDYRRVQVILEDLIEIRRDLGEQDLEDKRAEETKGFDQFQKAKHRLNIFVQDLRKEVDKLQEMRKNLGDGNDRSTDTIKLESENRKKISEALKMWNGLKEQYDKDKVKFDAGKLKDVDAQGIEDRKTILGILYQEIQELVKKNGRVRPLVSAAEEQEHRSRRETRNEKKRAERERRKRDKRKGSAAEDEPEPVEMSEQEVKFHDQVDQNIAEQDQLLDELSQGLTQLLALGMDMNKNLKLQMHLLDVIETKVDKNIAKLQNANKRMKDIMDQSGGMALWCPRIICIIIFVALIVYIVSYSG